MIQNTPHSQISLSDPDIPLLGGMKNQMEAEQIGPDILENHGNGLTTETLPYMPSGSQIL